MASHAPWSISKANVARGCTLRFAYKYPQRRKGREPQSSAGRIGSAVHCYIEYRMKEMPQRDALLKTFSQARQALTREERFSVMEVKDYTERFLERFGAYCLKHGVTIQDAEVEKAVAFTRDGTLVDYWDKSAFWRGKIDVALNAGGRILILDHKTGKRNDEKTERYTPQLNAYAVSAYYAYPEMRGAQTVLHWVQNDDPKQVFQFFEYVPRERIEKELIPWFFDYFDGAQRAVDAPARPQQADHCTFCEYKHLCPLFK